MADLLGTALTVGNGLASSNQSNSDLLIQAFKAQQQKPITTLNTKVSDLQARSVFLNTLRSNLQSLSSYSSNYSDSSSSINKFQSKTVTSSDTTVATVGSTSDGIIGTNTLKVDRLSAADVLVSAQKKATDASGIKKGTKKFDLTANGITSTVSVTFTGDETNEQAIQKIANSTNIASATSSTNTKTSGVIAGLIKDSSSTARLTFTSKLSGADNKITFTDKENVLSAFGITSNLNSNPSKRTVFSTKNSGYSQTDPTQLDAQAEVNGITIQRGTNSITDVLPGVTLTLLKPQLSTDQPITITNSLDPQAIASNVRPFLDSYNNTIRALSKEAPNFRSDQTLRSFQSNLRNTAGAQLGTGAYKYLSDVGITIAADGSVTVSDVTKLQTSAQNDPTAVAELFKSFADKIQTNISGILGDTGLINSRTTSIASQIKTTKQQITRLQSKVDIQAEALRQQYSKMQLNFIKAQQQSTMLSGFSQSNSQTIGGYPLG